MNKITEKIKELGTGRIVVIFLAGAMLLLLSFSEDKAGMAPENTGNGATSVTTQTVPKEGTTEYYEEKMKAILERTEGVGRVQVMLSPDLTGVVVVAEGAKDGMVVLEITNTAYVLFEIPAHKVRVLQYQ